MRIKDRKKRGLAIITTLMILSLLLALISAFLVVNRAGNKFTLNSLEKRQAQDIALTALGYAWYELEKDQNWATVPPSASTVQYPVSAPIIRFSQRLDGDTLVGDGVYAPNGNLAQPIGTVELRVRNNLKNTKNELTGIVPPRSVSVEATVRVGSITRKLDTLLRPKALSHESASAGRDLLLDDIDGLVRIESKDLYVNRIRSGNDLLLPDSDSVRFLKHGVAASGDRLKLGSTNLAGASDTVIKNAGDTVGGTFLPNSAPPNIKEFNPDDFDLPTDVSSIEAGEWRFGGATKREYIPHDLNFEEVINSFTGETRRGRTRRYQKKESTYDTLTSPSGRVYPAKLARLGSTKFEPPYTPSGGTYESEAAANSYGSDSPGESGFFHEGTGEIASGTPATPSDVHEIAPGVEVNVVTAQVVIHHGKKITSSGNLIFDGSGARSPELYFGYDLSEGGVASQTALDDGLDAAKNDPSKYMAAIVANGDINVTGGYIGYGSLIAGGNLTIKASSGLSAAPGLGVLVKGNNIIINPATEPEPALPGAVVDTDYAVFRDAVNADSGGDWTNYNNWLSHTQTTRDNMISSLRGRSTGISASTAWSNFDSQIGDGGSFPSGLLSSNGWSSGNLSVDQYVRLKTYYQTLAYGYNDGDGDPSWLNLSEHVEDSADRVENVLNGIAQWAESYKVSFKAFLDNPDPGLPDMFTEGLVFADNNITINADDKFVKLVGAVVAKNGDLRIDNASKLDLVYDRTLLDSLYLGLGGAVKLERVFFTFE